MPGSGAKIFLNLVRALFPRWDFYDRTGHQLDLEYKTEKSEWCAFTFTENRRWFSLFVNPQLNLALAEISLIEQFVMGLQEMQAGGRDVRAEEITALSAYQMLGALVGTRISADFRFRILALRGGQTDEIFVSDMVSGGGR